MPSNRPVSEKRRPRAGRPAGSKTFDAKLAAAFGRVARQRREELGLSQTDIYLRTGTDRVTTSAIETGKRQPSLEMIFRIAKGLECDPWTLVAAAQDEHTRSNGA
jgi:XRE family transcriptional regulator, regulator of sulfur utilization